MANPLFWYARHFKDYEEKTAHLSLMEHGAYTLLLDHYYKTRGNLPTNASAIASANGQAIASALLRICRSQTEAEVEGAFKQSGTMVRTVIVTLPSLLAEEGGQ
jgi:hypothetical protein